MDNSCDENSCGIGNLVKWRLWPLTVHQHLEAGESFVCHECRDNFQKSSAWLQWHAILSFELVGFVGSDDVCKTAAFKSYNLYLISILESSILS